MPTNFDISAALKVGKTEEQILQHLLELHPEFSYEGAKKVGKNDKQIMEHLAEMPYGPPETKELGKKGSASGRFLTGAAAEAFGTPNEELSPAASVASEIASRVASKIPIVGASVPFVKPIVENYVGQLQSGNVAGSLGALTSDAITFGAGKAAQYVKGIPRWLENKAARQYGKVLSTTKQIPKAVAESKVIPGAIERGTIAGTFEGLKGQVATNVEKYGDMLRQSWNALPESDRIRAQPLWDELQKGIDKTVVPGTPGGGKDIIADDALKAQFEQLQEKLIDNMNDIGEVSTTSARKWRQMMDDYVSKKGVFAGMDPTSAKVEAQTTLTNAIRAEINGTHPDIAAINKEFSFWKNFQDILDATSTRRVGQEGPVSRKIFIAAGAAAGLPAGPLTAAIDMSLLAGLDRTFRSTSWRTVNAVLKDRLAKAIASGQAANVNFVLKQIAASTVSNITAQ